MPRLSEPTSGLSERVPAMRHYDAAKQRIVYLTGTARPDDWDERWSRLGMEKLFCGGRNAWLVAETRRYLAPGALVLEGGCGCADKVFSLATGGYRAVGVDTAQRTLHRALQVRPDLQLVVGDIRCFPLADGAVDGYWSLGVFEHFEEGMQAQWQEASRIVRCGGFLFMTLPILSPLRRLKARLNAYPPAADIPPGRFYQYAYCSEEVIQTAAAHGFTLVHSRHFDGIKGLKDEVSILRPVLQRLYDSPHNVARLLRRFLDVACRAVSGHMGYFVFRRVDHARNPAPN